MPRLMFQRPRRIEWEDLTATFGRMTAEPFEKGYALTVGGSLRRVLLSAIPGTAVVWVKIPGVSIAAERGAYGRTRKVDGSGTRRTSPTGPMPSTGWS